LRLSVKTRAPDIGGDCRASVAIAPGGWLG
jgi:hypothetical protein